MKVFVIGGGGREHAIAWKLARRAGVTQVYASPGNPGIARVAECLPAASSSPRDLLAVADSVGADLTVVGPEAPLVAGVVDSFQAAGKKIVGPTAAAAQLEGSKIFAKRFMDRHGLPTARFITVETREAARKSLPRFDFPVVIKADGLAAGKGVIICRTPEEAESALKGMFSGELVGAAGSRLVIEEFLEGEEVSFIALSDGRNVVPLEPTQDHKAIYDGDRGPNTGGMGAYCDSRILAPEQAARIMETIISPAVNGMAEDGTPFAGFLYAGLMMTSSGPKLLEFNVRLGDPETQGLMLRMDSDFAAMLHAAASGDLAGVKPAWRPEPSVCVVMAAPGYPGKVRTGDRIEGIEQAEEQGAVVFHAGTRMGPQGLETAGGRVLGVTASGRDLADAIGNAYRAVDCIRFDGAQYRRDIGRKGLKRYNG
ncbi:MAG: phosphoribosylamine--glycine ligase [Bryobacteraceae bacterium]